MINNRYKILNKIGEGRSKVFACEDKFFPNEKIAIKILQYTANDLEIDSFNNEFKIIKNLNHPNIISAFDKGTILKLDDDYKSKFMI
ncbi:MAG: protein kinase, partial [Melioribacteraceae bacterium]|nr:protein kinase [Melioribacteraceae bacterium]